MVTTTDASGEGAAPSLRPIVRLLLWDFDRTSLAYELALAVVLVIVLVVPGGFWGDPLWPLR